MDPILHPASAAAYDEPEPATPHQALVHFDILKNIFEHLDLGYDSNDASASRIHLFRAALVCKAFLDPALDSLWSSMTTLLPLLKILPMLKEVYNVYVFHGEIHDHHWARLDWYASRVREFTASEPSWIPIETCLQLSQLRNSPLLPNLRRLRLCSFDPSLLSKATMVLSPNLESLEMDDGEPLQVRDPNTPSHRDYAIQSLFFTLGYKVPGLRRLTLRGFEASWEMIKRFSNLNSLTISASVNRSLLGQIGTLPNLESLTVNLEEHMLETGTPPPGGFTTLRSLTLTGPLAVVSSVIERIGSELIEAVSIAEEPVRHIGRRRRVQLDQRLECSQWSECLTRIDQKWGPRIRSLDIQLRESPSTNIGSEWPLDPSSYHFQLQRLSVQGWCISNLQLGVLASKFADLEELRLTSRSQATRPLSLSSLRILAESCPKLISLQISLDVGSTDVFDVGEVWSHGLKKLLVSTQQQQLSSGAPLRLARQLDRLFPRVVVEASSDVADAESWRAIRDFLSAFQEVRWYEQIRRGRAC